MRLTDDTPTSVAICSPVWRCRRNVSMAMYVVGGVWLGYEYGLEEGSRTPSHTFCAVPIDPFGDGPRCRIELEAASAC